MNAISPSHRSWDVARWACYERFAGFRRMDRDRSIVLYLYFAHDQTVDDPAMWLNWLNVPQEPSARDNSRYKYRQDFAGSFSNSQTTEQTSSVCGFLCLRLETLTALPGGRGDKGNPVPLASTQFKGCRELGPTIPPGVRSRTISQERVLTT